MNKEEQIKVAKNILKDIEHNLNGNWVEDWQKRILKKRQRAMKIKIKGLKEKGD